MRFTHCLPDTKIELSTSLCISGDCNFILLHMRVQRLLLNLQLYTLLCLTIHCHAYGAARDVGLSPTGEAFKFDCFNPQDLWFDRL